MCDLNNAVLFVNIQDIMRLRVTTSSLREWHIATPQSASRVRLRLTAAVTWKTGARLPTATHTQSLSRLFALAARMLSELLTFSRRQFTQVSTYTSSSLFEYQPLVYLVVSPPQLQFPLQYYSHVQCNKLKVQYL